MYCAFYHRLPHETEQAPGSTNKAHIADTDGIIPLTGGTGETTLAERLRACLRDEDGPLGAQRAESLLQELSGLSLDEWLRRSFFKRHVRQFKYRPVAWHLASNPSASISQEKGRKRISSRRAPAFECLLYYHACDSDILARLRTQYIEPLLRAARQHLESAHRSEQESEAAQTQERISELEDCSRRLRHVAEQGFASSELETLLAAEPLDRWDGDGYLPPLSHEALLLQERKLVC